MARLPGIDPEKADPEVRQQMKAQAEAYGTPWTGTGIMGRRPTIFKAYRAMFGALAESGLLPKGLTHLINRRVAMLIGCPF